MNRAPKHAPSPSGPGDAPAARPASERRIRTEKPIPYRLTHDDGASGRSAPGWSAPRRSGPGLAKAVDRDYPIGKFTWFLLSKLYERATRHGYGSWREYPVEKCMEWLRAEVAELDEAVARLQEAENDPEAEKKVLREQVVRECADVANLAMFVSYAAGGLK